MRSLFLWTVLLAGLAAPEVLRADMVDRHYMSHGTAGCQSALPVYDVKLRKRPMAIVNEGASDVFVTCDFDNLTNEVYNDDEVHGFRYVGVYFLNRTQDDVQVSCTLVNGILSVPRYISTKTVTAVSRAGYAAGVEWTAEADYEGKRFAHPALSCRLPPGVEITYVYSVFGEEIGL